MSYQKHVWVSKEVITAKNLNNMEKGIYDASVASEDIAALRTEMNSLKTDIQTAYNLIVYGE